MGGPERAEGLERDQLREPANQSRRRSSLVSRAFARACERTQITRMGKETSEAAHQMPRKAMTLARAVMLSPYSKNWSPRGLGGSSSR